ncbi:glycoside hydrolase family 13 protein [Arthrobacter crystallopoietes]|uniref:Alpha-glucosidase n=1 Tax=Crystallibacter crystallopoietes TaxID=37928 RepID=A0A1H1GLW0_9MICC|nr:glycoside hydrolase family 13 protein [Arthrobacter crystallopoietes]AUI52493.1 alpha-amylase [Arthrobacter crystallopoietes]SDR14149.1 alpha-glucosidase [Arthrobacter crystallopoietes]
MTDTFDQFKPKPDPNWWRQAAVYQIYPRSFADADGDGLGDIRGITAKIPYLAALGIDAVWLSPFYPSPLADGGYDVADYRDVDPRLGTLEDFDEMVAGLHAAEIKLIADIVPNHSSDQHEWFQQALAAGKGSPERERYIFRDGLGNDGGKPPSDWVSHFGGSAWTRITEPSGEPGQWYLHLFAKEQPDWNWENPEIREDFLKTLRFWSDRGVDGFRVDVAHALAKDMSEPLRSKPSVADELTPVDGKDPLFDRDEVHDIYAEWRKVFNEYDPPRTAVAEAWVPASRRMAYASPEGLGQAFNFDLLRADWDVEQFRSIITNNLSQAEESGASSTWVFSNHDVVRHPSRYGLPAGLDYGAWLMADGSEPEVDQIAGLRRARAATLLMLALPGSAYLYQGEELGLFEVPDLPAATLQDPIWQRTGHQRKGRDGCRIPLPWTTEGKSFGFGTDGAHLPQPDWFGGFSVEAQDGIAGSTLEFYRHALKLRGQLQSYEDLEWISGTGESVLHFERPGQWQSVTNFGREPLALPPGKVLISSSKLTAGQLPPDTTAWLTGSAQKT